MIFNNKFEPTDKLCSGKLLNHISFYELDGNF